MEESNSNRGNTLIYVMIALIILGFVISGLIRLTNKNAISQIYYSQSESARMAVQNGFSKAINILESTDTAAVRKRIQAFVNAKNPADVINTYRWVVGGVNSFDSITAGARFRTEILSFDYINSDITLRSEGYGKGNSRASAIAIYHLDGFGKISEITESQVPSNALQMDNGNFEFDCEFIVNGNTSIKDTMAMNNGPATFNGDFRFDSLDAGGIRSLTFNIPTTFAGDVYFDGPVNTFSPLVFKQNVGFERFFEHGNNDFEVTESSTVYFNAGLKIDGGVLTDMKNATVYPYDTAYYKGTNNVGVAGVFKSGTYVTPDGILPAKTINVDDAVGVGNSPAPKVHFNRNAIDMGKVYKTFTKPVWGSDQKSADTLNAWYLDAKANDMLWNGYMIIHLDRSNSEYYPFKDGTSTFKYKVIILCDDRNARFNQFYESDMSTGVTLLYLNQYTSYAALLRDVSGFRGFIYGNETGSNQLVITGIHGYLHIKGAVYFSENCYSKFEGGSGKTVEISYDSSLVAELANAGLFLDPNDSTTINTSKDLFFVKDRLYASLLSRSF